MPVISFLGEALEKTRLEKESPLTVFLGLPSAKKTTQGELGYGRVGQCTHTRTLYTYTCQESRGGSDM